MKKLINIIWVILILIVLSPQITAMQPPYEDTFIDYEAFLAGVDYYLFDEPYVFSDTELNLHEDYYISYRIEHSAYNRRTFKGNGHAIIIYQSKDPLKDYHFELNIRMKPGEEVMYIIEKDEFFYGALKGSASMVTIDYLNEKVLPNDELQMIFQSLCDLYGKTLVSES